MFPFSDGCTLLHRVYLISVTTSAFPPDCVYLKWAEIQWGPQNGKWASQDHLAEISSKILHRNVAMAYDITLLIHSAMMLKKAWLMFKNEADLYTYMYINREHFRYVFTLKSRVLNCEHNTLIFLKNKRLLARMCFSLHRPFLEV